MKDLCGREINYMRISITDRCNLRCQYCMPDGIELCPMKDLLTYEEIVSVCQEAVSLGIYKFKITGGEPLVRRGCADLIRMIYEIPGTEEVTLTTNGVLLEKYLPELSLQIQGIQSNIYRNCSVPSKWQPTGMVRYLSNFSSFGFASQIFI